MTNFVAGAGFAFRWDKHADGRYRQHRNDSPCSRQHCKAGSGAQRAVHSGLHIGGEAEGVGVRFQQGTVRVCDREQEDAGAAGVVWSRLCGAVMGGVLLPSLSFCKSSVRLLLEFMSMSHCCHVT